MYRFLISTALFCFAMCPQTIFCATSKKADKTVQLDSLASNVSLRLVKVSSFKIEYGNAPETSLGFQPGGNEMNKLAPNAFEVNQDGTITIFDPVHKKVFILRKKGDRDPALQVDKPYTYPLLCELESKHKISTVKAKKTGADTADIIFTEGNASRSVRLKTTDPIASVKVVGVNDKGEAFVLIERFVQLGSLDVEREILAVNSNGEIKARGQIGDSPLVPPVIEFQLAPDGSLYQMVPGDKFVTFVRFEVKR